MGEIFKVTETKISPIRRRKGKWKNTLRHSSKVCKWCGKRIHNKTVVNNSKATVDHIIPLCLDGPNTLLNTKVSCMWCNQGRASTGHCILALVCIEAVVGRSISKITKYYNQSVQKSVSEKVADNAWKVPVQASSPKRQRIRRINNVRTIRRKRATH